MLNSLTSGISGLQTFQTRMDVIGNNIANVNTYGYKSARTDFADSFSQTLRQSSAATGTAASQSAMQIGSGVNVGAIKNLYTQGALVGTDQPTDLALDGDGFFIVRDPISNENFVTRAGNFRISTVNDGTTTHNYLVTEGGLRLQGYTSDPSSGTAAVGDLEIGLDGTDPTLSMTGYSIDSEGNIKIKTTGGAAGTSEITRGQILLHNFTDPQGLVKVGNNLFAGIGAAGPTSATGLPPGTAGLGRIQAGKLELSNVELSDEFANMITAQRAFQASARIITTSDEMLQELVNLKR